MACVLQLCPERGSPVWNHKALYSLSGRWTSRPWYANHIPDSPISATESQNTTVCRKHLTHSTTNCTVGQSTKIKTLIFFSRTTIFRISAAIVAWRLASYPHSHRLRIAIQRHPSSIGCSGKKKEVFPEVPFWWYHLAMTRWSICPLLSCFRTYPFGGLRVNCRVFDACSCLSCSRTIL